ncbi:hypothetical protein SCATT_02040 [Streptantibioticus cattleyicolor NRRL 8057 = DSM 46488]|uniref:Uncharacterized protein n=1 Tax=Streptantibioticus cattleyicolor (strain ATCC 35852 / DSM 46488 / JCM 4925 / NBRC 14057 / NRRL 8057) TaxID=1003195 RepID=G8WMK7_STREN|nr:hypothetical protein SCATT_02040 [Streptantibioticus cattleyicolor NRRL 8057 = DSM 46488]
MAGSPPVAGAAVAATAPANSSVAAAAGATSARGAHDDVQVIENLPLGSMNN